MNNSILIADSHNLFRIGLKEIINKNQNYFVIGEAADGNELISKCIKLKPDVVISDLWIDKTDGISAILKSKIKIPSLKSIIVSKEISKFNMYMVYKSGIDGMLDKDSNEGELMFALNNVLKNNIYFSGIKNEDELKSYAKEIEPPRPEKEKFKYRFTKKEKEILIYLETGMSSEQIAEKMFVGKRTVDFYRAKLIQKLNFKSSNELIAFAVKYKLYLKYNDF